MSNLDFRRHVEEDARLIILKELAQQPNLRLSDTMLVHVLDSFGHSFSRDWVRTQLTRLEELGAVHNTQVGTVTIAELLRAGQDHVDRRTFLTGVARPSARGS